MNNNNNNENNRQNTIKSLLVRFSWFFSDEKIFFNRKNAVFFTTVFIKIPVLSSIETSPGPTWLKEFHPTLKLPIHRTDESKTQPKSHTVKPVRNNTSHNLPILWRSDTFVSTTQCNLYFDYSFLQRAGGEHIFLQQRRILRLGFSIQSSLERFLIS